jgi:TRAP-type C4-dicarboxylate transport system permease small subunit
MKKGFAGYHSFVSKLVKGSGILGALLFLIVMGITTYEVLMRYIFNAPTTWSLEISVILTLWATFLGVAYTLQQGGHTHVDLVINRFSQRGRRIIKIGIYLFMLLFCIFLTWTSLVPAIEAYFIKEVTQSYIRTPLFILMIPVPIGGLLLILEIVRQLFEKDHILPIDPTERM